MKDKILKTLKKYSMKYQNLKAVDGDVIIEGSDFELIANEIMDSLPVDNQVSQGESEDGEVDAKNVEGLVEYEWDDYVKEIHKIVEDYVLEYGGIEIELSDIEINNIRSASYKLDEGYF